MAMLMVLVGRNPQAGVYRALSTEPGWSLSGLPACVASFPTNLGGKIIPNRALRDHPHHELELIWQILSSANSALDALMVSFQTIKVQALVEHGSLFRSLCWSHHNPCAVFQAVLLSSYLGYSTDVNKLGYHGDFHDFDIIDNSTFQIKVHWKLTSE